MPSKAQPEIQKELGRLRDLTIRTGVLHPAQVLQLKMWGAILSPKNGSFTIKVNQDEKILEYCFVRLAKAKNLAAGLARSVRWLLGDDWVVNVSTGQKVIFRSKRLKTLGNPPQETESTPWRDKLNPSLL